MSPVDFFQVIWERFITAIRAKKSLSRPLTVPPDADTQEDRQKRRERNGSGNGASKKKA